MTRLRSGELRRGTQFMEAMIRKGSAMKMMDGVIRKLPVKYANGSIDLIEIDGIFYLKTRALSLMVD